MMNKEHKNYLDSLRESGRINMMEAPKWIALTFDISRQDAKQIFKEWTETFTKEEK